MALMYVPDMSLTSTYEGLSFSVSILVISLSPLVVNRTLPVVMDL